MSDDPFADMEADERSGPVLHYTVTGDDLFEDDDAVASHAPAVVRAAAASASSLTPSAARANDVIAEGAPSSGISFVEDSKAFLQWQETHEAELAKLAEVESTRAQATRDEALAWLEKFYAAQEKSKADAAAKNRKEEAAFVKERDQALSSGEPWQRAAFFCNFQLEGSEDSRDTSRFRDLMISLKN